jgi:hypothetical protein
MVTPKSILDGVREERNRITMTISQEEIGSRLKKMLVQIEANWRNSPRKNASRSLLNWKFRSKPEISPKNHSKEKKIEKAIVRLGRPSWGNQMPTASGLCAKGEGKRAIDLVHLDSETEYTFIELKVGANNPPYAARELLEYAVLYVFARRNMKDFLQVHPVLRATAVHLWVVAPACFYNPRREEWDGPDDSVGRSQIITQGLRSFIQEIELDCNIDFAFKSYPSEWKGDDTVENLRPVAGRIVRHLFPAG